MGSNIDPEHYLPQALERLSRLGRLVGVSTAYQNPAVGGKPQPDFLNAAALLEVGASSDELRTQLRAIEAELGRVRTTDRYAPRTIDLDLVWMENRIEHSPPLPDPEIDQRPHLAIPLAELAPDLRHPASGERLRSIADRLRPAASLTPHAGLTAKLRTVLERLASQSIDGEGRQQ